LIIHFSSSSHHNHFTMALRLFTFVGNPRANKALIAARYNSIDITIPQPFEMGKDNQSPEFLALNPLGKVPVLETPEGGIFESNAIARYVAGLKADTQLLGATYFESGQVSQWMEFSTTHLDLPVSNWVYQIIKWMQYNKGLTAKAQMDVKACLKVLDTHLLKNTYMVGNAVTLADITLVCTLFLPFHLVFDAEFRKPFPNLVRWYLTCMNQPEFAAILGEVKLCEKMQVAAAPAKPAKAAKGGGDGGGKKGKKGKGQAQQPKAAKKPSKPKHPLDALPKTSMAIDEWKRQYSNLETRGAGGSIEWLWKNYDASGYCMYFVKHPDQHEQGFMACNLLGGWFQRCEPINKYAFASMLVLGVEGDITIQGMFMYRGQEIPECAKEVADHDVYEFTKVDTDDPKQRELVEAYLAWDGDALPAECLDGKNFK